MSKQVTVDVDVLNELIEAKVQARVAGLKTEAIAPLEKRLAEAAALATAPQKEEFFDYESPLTGATFKVRVLTSRSFPKGRVVDLSDYVHPPSSEVHVEDGGSVPTGQDIKNKDGAYTAGYKMWRYTEYLQKDLREVIGKPLTTYFLKSEADKRRAAEAAADKAAE